MEEKYMSKIISIQNSGESFEKCIALFNTAIQSDNSFYTCNEFNVFYGHNLPKKDCKVNSHGTIGFYEKYFSKYEWNPIKSEKDLFIKREEILQILLNNGYISNRNFLNLIENDINYIQFIRKIPMEYVFPNLIFLVKEKVEKIFPNVQFKELFLENNVMKYYTSLPLEKWAYSIYALNIDGTVGRYYFNNLGEEKYYNRNLAHMFNELLKSPVLSANSALLLAEIEDATRNMKYPIGYRKHSRENRTTRNFALQHFLEKKEGVIEPKNIVFSKYFNFIDLNQQSSSEAMANIVIARVYEDFLNEYQIF